MRLLKCATGFPEPIQFVYEMSSTTTCRRGPSFYHSCRSETGLASAAGAHGATLLPANVHAGGQLAAPIIGALPNRVYRTPGLKSGV